MQGLAWWVGGVGGCVGRGLAAAGRQLGRHGQCTTPGVVIFIVCIEACVCGKICAQGYHKGVGCATPTGASAGVHILGAARAVEADDVCCWLGVEAAQCRCPCGDARGSICVLPQVGVDPIVVPVPGGHVLAGFGWWSQRCLTAAHQCFQASSGSFDASKPVSAS